MSQFPNVVTLPGIDQVGASFLSGEVGRLQSDTENKRNVDTAQRGQDMQMQAEAAQMKQQQRLAAQEMEHAHTENAITRSHQTMLEKARMGMESLDTKYNALLAAGDVEGMRSLEEERARLQGDYDTGERKLSALGVIKALKDQAVTGGVDPTTGKPIPSVFNQVMERMNKDDEARGMLGQSMVGAMKEAMDQVLTSPSNHAKAVREAENIGAANSGLNLEGMLTGGPTGAMLRMLYGDTSKDAKTPASMQSPLDRVAGNVAGTLVGWGDAVTGAVAEPTPAEHSASVARQMSKNLAPLIQLSDPTGGKIPDAVVAGALDGLFTSAAAAAAERDGQKRAALLSQVKAHADELRKGGLDEATLKLMAGAVHQMSKSQEANRGASGELDRDSRGSLRWSENNQAMAAMGRALEEGAGVRSGVGSFMFGADGSLKYTGQELPAAQLQRFMAETLDGELSGESQTWLSALEPRVRAKIIEEMKPHVEAYVKRIENIAENAGISPEELIEKMPGGKAKVKNVLQLYRRSKEESEKVKGKQDRLLGDELISAAKRKGELAKQRYQEERGLTDTLTGVNDRFLKENRPW